MLKNLLAEVHFRVGRRRKDKLRLARATKLNRYNSRAAIELARMAEPGPLCNSLVLSLAALRDCSVLNGLNEEQLAFLQLIIQELSNSRGQCFQDLAALHFSGRRTGGYFAEVGTGNGEALSNTFLLEKRFGWKGLLFEPNQSFHGSIREKRNATLIDRPAYGVDNQLMTFLSVDQAGQLSTLETYRNNDGRSRTGTSYDLQTITLNTAFLQQQAPSAIDYISLDTEGSELEILKGLDLHRYKVRFMTIEHNYEIGKAEAIADYLIPFGYRVVFPEFSAQDIWLVRDKD